MVEMQDKTTHSPPNGTYYDTPFGTRWSREKAQAGGEHIFETPTDRKYMGDWVVGKCIGKGASGRVKLAHHSITGQRAAIKIIPAYTILPSKNHGSALYCDQRASVYREIAMMKLMNHPNIVRIYDVYESERELFLVLEYIDGGELYDLLTNRGCFPQIETLALFKQIIHGLNYAHTFSIVHRDLKPENILVASLSPPVVKIADWGMATFAPPGVGLTTSCGSPHYASPEVVSGRSYHGTAADIWSCGVVLYTLLTGTLPFNDRRTKKLLEKIKVGEYDIPCWIDPRAQNLLGRMLVVDPEERITMREILAHPWMRTPITTMLEKPVILKPPLPPTLHEFGSAIPSPDLIDNDLFYSLMAIWGRHTDPSGDAIRADLCSPPGYGTHSKAFYYLLEKHRSETRRMREAHRTSEEDLSAMTSPGGNFMRENSASSNRLSSGSSAATSAPTSNSIDAVLSEDSHDPNGPHSSQTPDPSHIAPGFCTFQDDVWQPLSEQDDITLSKALCQSYQPVYHIRSRRCVGPRPPAPMHRYSYTNIYNLHEGSDMLKARAEQPNDRAKSHLDLRKECRAAKLPIPSSTSPRVPYATARPILSSRVAMIPAPFSVSQPMSAIPVKRPHVRTRTVLNPSELVNLSPPCIQPEEKSWTIVDTPQCAKTLHEPPLPSGNPHLVTKRVRRSKEEAEKTIALAEEGWMFISTGNPSGGAKQLKFGTDITNIPLTNTSATAVSKGKENQVQKGKQAPPLNLRHKRSAITLSSSPTRATDTLPHPSISSSAYASPIKGWFSNLFKPAQLQDVLYSPHDIHKTRLDIIKFLESYGVIVNNGTITASRAVYTDELQCRVKIPTAVVLANITLKPVVFRVTFRPVQFISPSYSPLSPEDDSYFLTAPPQFPENGTDSKLGIYHSSGTPPKPAGSSEMHSPTILSEICFLCEKGSGSTVKIILKDLKKLYESQESCR
ncbi:kinase-like domain-containing protein [Crucibulum laeve]|uniref:Kinase-like domain-containing protein n=1 Tax=Crucibulum laeve TaxID=68775 RepID=A0A5C3LPI4_9AGAR|nr:kinase-like domain-containing protein [Crucibulum laeve]